MYARARLYSNKDGEIYRFLNSFLKINEDTQTKKNSFSDMYLHSLEWENIYPNPIDIANIIGIFIDNSNKFSLKLWVSLDKDFFINISDDNANDMIKYLYERYPY